MATEEQPKSARVRKWLLEGDLGRVTTRHWIPTTDVGGSVSLLRSRTRPTCSRLPGPWHLHGRAWSMAGQIGHRELVGAIARTCGVSGGQRPPTARNCAGRPVIKLVFHAPLLGHPSGRTEEAITPSGRPRGWPRKVMRFRPFVYYQAVLKWPCWCINQSYLYMTSVIDMTSAIASSTRSDAWRASGFSIHLLDHKNRRRTTS